MCEGIARAGNGVCLMATTSENILGKCAKLVRASRTLFPKNVSVDWGVPSEKPSKVGYSFRPVPSKRESTVLQSPSKIEAIYPGLRLVVTAMIKDEAFKIPEEVVLRAQLGGNGEPFVVRVPVEVVQPSKDDDTIPLVNTLAARRIITELEDPKKESQHTEAQKKATIIRIGEEYQLASRYTSFVAVGDHISEYQKGSSKEKAKEREKVRKEGARQVHVKGPSLSNFVGNFFGSSGSGAPAEKEEEASEDEEEKASDSDDDWDFTTPMSEPGRAFYSASGSPAPTGGGRMMMMKKSRAIPSPRGRAGAVFGRASAAVPPPPPPMALPSAFIPSAPPQPSRTILPTVSAAPILMDMALDIGDQRKEAVGPAPQSRSRRKVSASYGGASNEAQSTEKPVVRLVRLQAFDGSFTLNDEFRQIIGKDVADQEKGTVNDTIWATALAIAYFRKYLADEPELLDGLVEKAMDFVSQSPLGQGVDFNGLLEKAKGLV